MHPSLPSVSIPQLRRGSGSFAPPRPSPTGHPCEASRSGQSTAFTAALPRLLPGVALSMALLAGCSATGTGPGADEPESAPPPPPETLSGTATWRERMALPSGAQLEVVLEDISLADAPATMLGQTLIDNPGNPPVEFQLEYDPARIEPGHRYALRARVSLQGQLLLVTDTVHPALEGDNHTPELLLRAVERSNETALTLDSAVALEDTHWHLVELSGRDITDSEQQAPAHLILQAQDQRAVGAGGCNRYFGSYSLQGESLTFGQLASTMMACMKGMDVEQQLHDALGQTVAWRIVGGHLELLNEAGTVVARFEPRIGE